MRWLRVVLVLPGLLWLAACQSAGNSLPMPVPTEMLPTIIAQTVQAGQALQPQVTKTDIPTLVAPTSDVTASRTPIPPHTLTPRPTDTATATHTMTATASLTPTITPTTTDTPRPEIPPSAIRILSPAPLSRVTSPIEVRAVLAPGAGGQFRIELLGEDGRLLARQVLKYSGERVNANLELIFEIPGVAETGRLQISTTDAFGRVMALSSSNIILMSVGKDEYNTASDLRERILILQPTPEDLLLGGSLTIFGKAWPNEDEPLLVELIAENGAVVGQRLASVQAEPGEDYGIFTTEIAYQVTEPTAIRLTVYEDIDRIPGKTHITSMEVVLNP